MDDQKLITFDVIEVEGNIAQALNWCQKTFGPPGERWFIVNHRFHFSNESDTLIFTLKWL